MTKSRNRLLALQPRNLESTADALLGYRQCPVRLEAEGRDRLPGTNIFPFSRGFATAVRVRTCNSVTTKMPGMFASINKITDPSTGEVTDYISNAGIPSISNQTVQDLDVNVPGSVFPTILVDKSVGLAWWRNMVVAKKMQRR